MALLEEAIEKLSFLGSITPDVLTHKDELSKFVGDEISRIVEEQKRLETKYEELITERMSLKGLANKLQYKVVQAQISDVSRLVRESTKQLCRNLKDNPNISGNLMKIQRDRTELIEVGVGGCRWARAYRGALVCKTPWISASGVCVLFCSFFPRTVLSHSCIFFF